ncbi:hypothetical protein [Secundilactobacillus odoratitofui]
MVGIIMLFNPVFSAATAVIFVAGFLILTGILLIARAF